MLKRAMSGWIRNYGHEGIHPSLIAEKPLDRETKELYHAEPQQESAKKAGQEFGESGIAEEGSGKHNSISATTLCSPTRTQNRTGSS